MKNYKHFIAGLAIIGLPIAAYAQLSVPKVSGPGPVPQVDIPDTITDALSDADLDRLLPAQAGQILKKARLNRLKRFIQDNRDVVADDGRGNPAVKRTVLVTGIEDSQIVEAQNMGLIVQSRETIKGLDLSYIRFTIPEKMRIKKAIKRLEKIAPQAAIDADHIYFASGNMASAPATAPAPVAVSGHAPASGPVRRSALWPATAAAIQSDTAAMGLIDGGVSRQAQLPRLSQRGFAKGAPRASDHGTAVASLMVLGGVAGKSGGRGQSAFLAADVYGTDRAGGNAAAIAQALGWLAANGTSVVTISLVGPPNRLLALATKRAQQKGVIIVAAVGNDGPASPAVYPAAYKGVISVTGVNKSNRLLPEAGRASNTDFAAPGVGIFAIDTKGGKKAVRGTSFAAPLVASRLAHYYPRQSISNIAPAIRKLIAEAKDLGKKGRDKKFGHGLLCADCAKSR